MLRCEDVFCEYLLFDARFFSLFRLAQLVAALDSQAGHVRPRFAFMRADIGKPEPHFEQAT